MKFTTYVNVQDEPEVQRPNAGAGSGYGSGRGGNVLSGQLGAGHKAATRILSRPVLFGIALLLVTLVGARLLFVRSSGSASALAQKHVWSEGPHSIVPSAGWGGNAGAALPLNSEAEVRFGIVGPFTGPSKELGREMALGLNAAFAKANEAGGIAGRKLTPGHG